MAACQPESPPPLAITLIAPSARPTSSLTDPLQRRGQEVYNLVCAHCHGYSLEGQLASTIDNTLALGMHLVPALSSQGHIWQHPDQLLERVIREGIASPLPQYPMPAFGEDLDDRDIRAVIAYVKLWWTADQRELQARLTDAWDARLRELGITGEIDPLPALTPETMPAQSMAVTPEASDTPESAD